MTTSSDRAIIDAIYRDALASLDEPVAHDVCVDIGRRTAKEAAEAIAVLASAGIDTELDGDPSQPAQRHTATITLADAELALAAAKILTGHGYRPWDPIDGPIAEVIRRFRSMLTMARTDDITMVLHLRWPVAGGRFLPASAAARVPDALVPNVADERVLPIPTRLWPALFALRPVRLAAERFGLRDRAGQALGPFLATPTDLIEPLLDLAEVGPDDVVVDLGCGDGRILVQAVARRGCRAVGIEQDPDLAAAARRRAAEAGVGDRVDIRTGSITDSGSADPTTVTGSANSQHRSPTEDGTVFFIFVPAQAASDLVTTVTDRAAPGTRIVAHEQHRLPDAPAEAESVALMAGQGVTVAHRWTVS